MLVYPNGMLTATIAFQSFQPVARRGAQILQTNGSIHHVELPKGDHFEAPPLRRAGAVPEQPLSRPVGKAADHAP
ncbi:hypothetical protein BRAS3843_2020038 [Bradyrhizobium sp. STM 3843]|nr:hypothetical protein BRAS3843_2020038 [Bradyrhizobium sp. STM 3843]